jgi:glyoxylase-like metal-dependent hydrolase (beta-lactamase superfamily II)
VSYEICAFGPVVTNSILVYSETSSQALLFDLPPGSVAHWKKRLHRLEKSLSGIFFTHSHWDHIADAALGKALWNVPIAVHEKDMGNLQCPGSDHLPTSIAIQGVVPDLLLKEEKGVVYAGFSMDILHTPGHSPGSISIYFPYLNFVITGDTLFRDGIGRLDLPTSQPEQMRSSLQKIFALPDMTLVLPGHGRISTVGEEKSILAGMDDA